jgi:hypothetical protein
MEGIRSRLATITAALGWLTGRLKRPFDGPMLLLASIIISFLAASSAPTPLYALYQTRWGFSAITTTVIFGVYASPSFVLAAVALAGLMPPGSKRVRECGLKTSASRQGACPVG